MSHVDRNALAEAQHEHREDLRRATELLEKLAPFIPENERELQVEVEAWIAATTAFLRFGR